MPTPDLFPCFGIEMLGLCKYDPQAPSPSYFTVGDAVAALAFTFAVQQFLRPIYLFRLRALRIRFYYVVVAVFLGGICTVIAAAVPSIPALRGSTLAYPLNWEIAGALIIGGAYAIVAAISLRPAVVHNRNVGPFTWAGAHYLAQANDEDRLRLAEDLLSSGNLSRLAKIASEFERGKMHAVMIEFEKLREKGLEGQGVRGTVPLTPFYQFARRKQLERASHAWHFLQLISDTDFCRVIVTRHSWGFIGAVMDLADRGIYDGAGTFVQTVAWQALIQEEGMLAKEDGFEGFGRSRSFANELFGNPKILALRPLDGINSMGSMEFSKGYVSRLNIASSLMFQCEITSRGFWERSSTMGLRSMYESLSHAVSYQLYEGRKPNFLFQFERGVVDIVEIVSKELDKRNSHEYSILFAENTEPAYRTVVDDVANIVSDALESVSNKFSGFDDLSWSFALSIIGSVFDQYGDIPQGMSPLQQAVAIRIVDKLRDNMRGYYPALSRVMLAVIGPYEAGDGNKPGTARTILKNCLYEELKKIPALYDRDPDKLLDKLPPHVVYDRFSNSLTHTYRDGAKRVTILDEVETGCTDLLDATNLRVREVAEPQAA